MDIYRLCQSICVSVWDLFTVHTLMMSCDIYFSIPFIVFALHFSLVVRVTSIGGHIAASSLLLPITVRALHS